MKRVLVQFTDNAGPDQPALKRRLIRAFIVRLQNQWMLLYMLTNRESSDQTARMRMLIWTYVALKLNKGPSHALRLDYASHKI